MHLRYNYRLDPPPRHRIALGKTFGCARVVFNDGLRMIMSGGMNIYPAEIEAALEQHPGIFDVAVFGIPSMQWGEQVHATVVLAPGASLSEADVIGYARRHLGGYKCPRSVSFTAELPRTGSGKLLKRKLRAPYWAGHTTQVS